MGVYCVETGQYWDKRRLAPQAAREAMVAVAEAEAALGRMGEGAQAPTDGRAYVAADLPDGVADVRDCAWTGEVLRALTKAERDARDAERSRAVAAKKLLAPVPGEVVAAFMTDYYATSGATPPEAVAAELARRAALRETAAGK